MKTTAEWTPKLFPDLISRLCRGECHDVEVSRVVNLCVDMAAAYLKYLESAGRRICETGVADEFHRLACDGIAELFARDAQGRYPALSRVFTPLQARNAPADEWLMLLRRLVTRRMQQHLQNIYRERNPERARLLRNIRLAAQHSPNLNLRRDLLGLTLEYYPSESPPGEPFVRPPQRLLEAVAAQVFHPRMTVDEMMQALLGRLSLLLNAPVMVALIELITLISDFRLRVQEMEEADEPEFGDDKRLLLIVKAARHSLIVIKKNLVESYVEKGKLTLGEALALFSAVKETLLDRLREDEEELPILAANVRRHWPELDEERYRKQIRPLLDYIVKVYRMEMRRRLTDVL